MLLTAIAVLSTAAMTYRVEITSSWPPARRAEATVLVQGRNRRVTLAGGDANPAPFQILLSNDGGATTIALNTTLKSWFDWPSGLVTPPRIYQLPLIPSDTTIRNIAVTVNEEPDSESLEGLPTRKFVGRVSYVMSGHFQGELIEASVSSTILLWTTDKLDASLAFRAVPLNTGVTPVDAELQPKLDAIRGFPLKIQLSATRVIKGGPPVTELITATVGHIGTTPASPEMFKRPADFRYQRPVVAAPGLAPP